MKNKITLLFFFTVIGLLQVGCNTIDVFEKNTPIPGHNWHNNSLKSFEFNITDISKQYALFIVLRHTDDYKYNNIWLNIGYQSPGDTMRFSRVDFQLGDDAKGWEGTGMDDIWEVRKQLNPQPLTFKKIGTYHFSIAQIMRENPLPEILSIGLRIEKLK